MRLAYLLVCLPFLALAACSADDGAKQKPAAPQVTPADFDTEIPTGMVMEHVISPAAFGVWGASGYELDRDGVHDLTPKNDGEWEAVVNHAATLREASNLLLLPGRVPDAKWIGLVGEFRKAAKRLMVAAEAHNAKDLGEAGDALNVACEGCHSSYNLTAKHYTRPAESRAH